jgi:hypothetical protein
MDGAGDEARNPAVREGVANLGLGGVLDKAPRFSERVGDALSIGVSKVSFVRGRGIGVEEGDSDMGANSGSHGGMGACGAHE